MIKYAKIINNETGLCEVGLGSNEEFYKSIGMTQLDVEQSDIDFCWYLTDKCPKKTDTQKLQEAKEAKLSEAAKGAKDFIENEACFPYDKDNSIEATDGNIGKLTAYALGFQTGQFEVVQWTSKEDNVLTLNEVDLMRVLLGLGAIQSDVWNVQYVSYKNQIEEAQTIEDVEKIIINYESED